METDEELVTSSIGELVKKIDIPEKVSPILTVSLEPRNNVQAMKMMALQGEYFNQGKVTEALSIVIPPSVDFRVRIPPIRLNNFYWKIDFIYATRGEFSVMITTWDESI